jgi:hypothetical protein
VLGSAFFAFQACRPSPRQAPNASGGKKLHRHCDAGPLGLHARLAEAPAFTKELAMLPRTNLSSLNEEERRAYENLVVRFFLQNLPVNPAPAR